jgi:hypothetical protein
MDELNKLCATQSESHVENAWTLVENGKKLLQASMLLMYFINATIKNYNDIALNFAVFGRSIISMTLLQSGSILPQQLDEINEFLDWSKSVSGSFSAIALTLTNSVGDNHFMDNLLFKPVEAETLSSLETKFKQAFIKASSYKEQLPADDFDMIHSELTKIMDQLSQNLASGRNSIRVAEEILGEVLRMQRTVESAISAPE